MISRRGLLLGTVAAAVVPAALSATGRSFVMEFPKDSQQGLRHIPFKEGRWPGLVQSIIYGDSSWQPREYSGFTPFYTPPDDFIHMVPPSAFPDGVVPTRHMAPRQVAEEFGQ